jgi:glycosyltransferase involved in cell wall biosynthesis
VLSQFASRIVSVSEDGRRRTIDEGVRADRAYFIRNGVDVKRFDYVGPDASGPAYLVCRLSPEKDVTTLIHAVKHIEQSQGSHATIAPLHIVGDGLVRRQLEALSQSLGLGDKIRFLGERTDVPELLGSASMFVLPSLTEGISLTLLEAMARGLPVVATRVGGNPEVVVDNVTGLLVPPSDPESLAAAMLRIHQDPALGREMGVRGRQRVEQEFSIQQMVRAYERHYVDEDRP